MFIISFYRLYYINLLPFTCYNLFLQRSKHQRSNNILNLYLKKEYVIRAYKILLTR